ncbi:MAG: glycosyltransferase, partial [Nitrososphaerota archaeon]
MAKDWLIQQTLRLDGYQIYIKKNKVKALLTGFHAYATNDKIILDLIYEDDNYIYPIIFTELIPAKKVFVIPSKTPIDIPQEDLAHILKALESLNLKSGYHVTVDLIQDSFFATFGRKLKLKNPHKTPYLGWTDHGSHMRSYIIYSHFGKCLHSKARTVLDIGCGSGYGSALLAKIGFDVTGVDIDELAISFAKRIFKDKPVSFECQHIDSFVRAGRRFDAVLACEVVEHVDNPEEFVDKLLCVVKPSGYVAISVPTWTYHGIDLNSDHRSNWTLTKAEKFFRRFFRLQRLWSVNVSPAIEKYSVNEVTTDQKAIENILLFGKRTESIREAPYPSSVLLVCHNVYPYELSGTPIITWKYAQELHRLGYRVGILIPIYAASGYRGNIIVQEQDGIPIYKVPAHPYPSAFLDSITLIERKTLEPIERVLSQFHPDIVHVNDYVNLLPHVLQLASDFGAIVVRHVHNSEEICMRISPVIPELRQVCDGPIDIIRCVQCLLKHFPNQNEFFNIRNMSSLLGRLYGWREYLNLLYNRVVDVVIFTNRVFRDYFSRFVQIAPDKMYIIPHGLVPGRKVSTSLFQEPLVCGYLGNIHFRKGIDVLIKAFKNLPKNKVQLQVYGAVYDQKLFEELLSVPGVKYMGAYDCSNLENILSNIDIGVIPSNFETYCVVLREFLSHGVPVIATRFFGSDIVEDGKNGFLVDVGNADELKKRIEML